MPDKSRPTGNLVSRSHDLCCAVTCMNSVARSSHPQVRKLICSCKRNFSSNQVLKSVTFGLQWFSVSQSVSVFVSLCLVLLFAAEFEARRKEDGILQENGCLAFSVVLI